MGWLDNLESDLALANQPSTSGMNTNSQSGHSHVTTTFIEGIREDRAAVTATAEEKEDDSTDVKEVNPYALFAEKVGVCGLQEAYNAVPKASRVMFRLALLAATGMIFYQAIGIAHHYQNQSVVLLKNEINQRAPFPIIAICLPSVLNEAQLERLMDVQLPPRVVSLMEKHHFTKTDVVNFFKNVMSLNLNPADIAKAIYLVARKVLSVIMQTAARDGKSLKYVMEPNCSEIFSNCTFESWRFDCCSAAQFSFRHRTTCYQINVNQMFDMQTNNSAFDTGATDPPRLDRIGLTIDVSANWSSGVFQEGSASDGFHVFIDRLPGDYADPVYVPSGMDALVTLSRPKMISDLRNCIAAGQIPKLKYFDSYDPNGNQCIGDLLNDIVLTNLGCLMPMHTYFPSNKTCNFEQVVTLTLAVTDAFAIGDATTTALLRNSNKAMTASMGTKSSCKPLCSRWAYPVLSTSYGSIQYRDKIEEERQLANRSWSRIRIILPHSTSTSEQEKHVLAAYLALCDIGMMMAAYAGFSIITFAQILFYGFNVVCSKRKSKNAVTPTTKEPAVGAQRSAK